MNRQYRKLSRILRIIEPDWFYSIEVSKKDIRLQCHFSSSLMAKLGTYHWDKNVLNDCGYVVLKKGNLIITITE